MSGLADLRIERTQIHLSYGIAVCKGGLTEKYREGEGLGHLFFYGDKLSKLPKHNENVK